MGEYRQLYIAILAGEGYRGDITRVVGVDSEKGVGVHRARWDEDTIMTERTRESADLQSICTLGSVVLTKLTQ